MRGALDAHHKPERLLRRAAAAFELHRQQSHGCREDCGRGAAVLCMSPRTARTGAVGCASSVRRHSCCGAHVHIRCLICWCPACGARFSCCSYPQRQCDALLSRQLKQCTDLRCAWRAVHLQMRVMLPRYVLIQRIPFCAGSRGWTRVPGYVIHALHARRGWRTC